jgi:hypothetical protein
MNAPSLTSVLSRHSSSPLATSVLHEYSSISRSIPPFGNPSSIGPAPDPRRLRSRARRARISLSSRFLSLHAGSDFAPTLVRPNKRSTFGADPSTSGSRSGAGASGCGFLTAPIGGRPQGLSSRTSLPASPPSSTAAIAGHFVHPAQPQTHKQSTSLSSASRHLTSPDGVAESTVAFSHFHQAHQVLVREPESELPHGIGVSLLQHPRKQREVRLVQQVLRAVHPDSPTRTQFSQFRPSRRGVAIVIVPASDGCATHTARCRKYPRYLRRSDRIDALAYPRHRAMKKPIELESTDSASPLSTCALLPHLPVPVEARGRAADVTADLSRPKARAGVRFRAAAASRDRPCGSDTRAHSRIACPLPRCSRLPLEVPASRY